MKLVEFNLNEYIHFKLTEKGKKRLADSYFRVRVGEPNDDLYRSQLWVFCGLFGAGMQYPTASGDVETVVYFDSKHLEEVPEQVEPRDCCP